MNILYKKNKFQSSTIRLKTEYRHQWTIKLFILQRMKMKSSIYVTQRYSLIEIRANKFCTLLKTEMKMKKKNNYKNSVLTFQISQENDILLWTITTISQYSVRMECMYFQFNVRIAELIACILRRKTRPYTFQKSHKKCDFIERKREWEESVSFFHFITAAFGDMAINDETIL